MNRLLLTGLSLFFIFGVRALSAGEDITQALTAFLNERSLFDNQTSGMVVGFVDERGSRVVSFGKMGDGTDRDLDADTMFEIGSISKTFTTLLLQDAIERGEMQLGDPVGKYLPDSVKVPSRNGKQITLLHLATNSSGLPFNTDNIKPFKNNGDNTFADYTTDKFYDFLARHNLQSGPGDAHQYSNAGMGLLGHAIELNARKNYGDLIVERICEPLGMNSTGVALTPAMQKRFATGHANNGKPAEKWDLGVQAGAGGVRSSANDLLKYVAAQCGLTECQLTPSIKRTHEIRFRNLLCWGNAAMPWFDLGTYSPTGSQLLGHGGGTGGYSNFVGFDCQQRRGIVMLSNQTSFSASTLGWLMLQSSWHADQRPTAVELDPRVLDSCVGQYQADGYPTMSVRRNGKGLSTQGHFNSDLLPSSEKEFFGRLTGMRLATFVRDSDGRVTALVFHRSGTDFHLVKISDQPLETVEVVKPSEKVDPITFDALVGQYQLDSGVILNVTRDAEKLFAHAPHQTPQEFRHFTDGRYNAFIGASLRFVKNDDGNVSGLIISHLHGQDRHAKRVEPTPAVEKT